MKIAHILREIKNGNTFRLGGTLIITLPVNGAPTKFNIVLRFNGDHWIASCLELDIVATANAFDQAARECGDLIVAQIEYAVENDNLDNLIFNSIP